MLRGNLPVSPNPFHWSAGADRRFAPGGGWLCLDQRGVSALGSAAGAGLGLFLLARDLLADLLQGASNEARHVHLRDADLLSDLRLRQPLEETQVQNHPLPLVEHAEPGSEHRPVLGDLVLWLLRAQRLEWV